MEYFLKGLKWSKGNPIKFPKKQIYKMTKGVENWTYKSKAEIEALDDKQLLRVQKELTEAFKMFSQHGVQPTDEMVWQLMVVPGIVASRGLTVLCN